MLPSGIFQRWMSIGLSNDSLSFVLPGYGDPYWMPLGSDENGTSTSRHLKAGCALGITASPQSDAIALTADFRNRLLCMFFTPFFNLFDVCVNNNILDVFVIFVWPAR